MKYEWILNEICPEKSADDYLLQWTQEFNNRIYGRYRKAFLKEEMYEWVFYDDGIVELHHRGCPCEIMDNATFNHKMELYCDTLEDCLDCKHVFESKSKKFYICGHGKKIMNLL